MSNRRPSNTNLVLTAVMLSIASASSAAAQVFSGANPNAKPAAAGDPCTGFGSRYRGSAGGGRVRPMVATVSQGGPAVAAGITIGDTILTFGAKNTVVDRDVFRGPQVGDTVPVSYKRGADVRNTTLVMGVLVDYKAASLADDNTATRRSPFRCTVAPTRS
ncbi:MAG TPA: hypothetical protein VE869_13845 [Gemmatimonas sp.]|nr:hypothetical protein [Gemmatimonas sp.]